MVILKNKNTDHKLNVEDYDYPFYREYWDSNWLSINIEIKDFQDNLFLIINKDNCLLTIELVKLKEWLSYLKNIHIKMIVRSSIMTYIIIHYQI